MSTSSEMMVNKRTRGRPRQGEIEIIDTKLLEGALQEFIKTGYGGTAMSQIVRALGISKTTLYSRFASKEALFEAIIKRQVDRLSGATALQVDGTWLELGMGLRAYANRTLEVSLEGELRQVNLLIYSEAHRFPELGMAAAERSQQGIGQISEFIIQCAERDQVSVRDPVGVAEAFIFMLRGWYVNVLLTDQPVSAAVREAWVERAVAVLLSDRSNW
ncbi:TetR family transcriptional regulator [Novosphingobium sp. PhB55]|uniref:TetR/AcrR family transcriptional regulator n=1 Tax=Novosphingobium sp. PhB55 TaxID=2485106 RepID=UPI0010E769C3|nr:TetR/AcrR family transcriptional regulator [Novosphingobium sp. PhB55]TDW61520.1 TetR family transcriptional regulator [Novosphingobium sp. PhB55]